MEESPRSVFCCWMYVSVLLYAEYIIVLSVVYIYEINVETKRSDFDLFGAF